jgi:hypothetical protein
LSGTVRTAAGEPLAGKLLVCRTGRSPSSAVTAADGRFEMDARLVRGELYTLQLVDSTFVLRPADVQHTAGSDRALELEAVEAAFVTARLVDPQGRPVPFVRTELWWRWDTRPPVWTAVASRLDGTVVFTGVPGVDLDLRVHAAGDLGAGSREPIRLAAGEKLALEVEVAPAGTVAGQMVDADGRPRPGVEVMLQSFDVTTGQPRRNGSADVPTDRQGRYVFLGVAPGLYLVRAALGGGAPRGRVFEIASGERVSIDL